MCCSTTRQCVSHCGTHKQKIINWNLLLFSFYRHGGIQISFYQLKSLWVVTCHHPWFQTIENFTDLNFQTDVMVQSVWPWTAVDEGRTFYRTFLSNQIHHQLTLWWKQTKQSFGFKSVMLVQFNHPCDKKGTEKKMVWTRPDLKLSRKRWGEKTIQCESIDTDSILQCWGFSDWKYCAVSLMHSIYIHLPSISVINDFARGCDPQICLNVSIGFMCNGHSNSLHLFSVFFAYCIFFSQLEIWNVKPFWGELFGETFWIR